MSLRPRGTLPPLLGLLLPLAAACTAESRPESPAAASGAPATLGAGAAVVPRARVEGGVRVLEHAADAFERAPQYTVDPAPLAVLGRDSDEGTYDLTWASSVVPLSDGRVATYSPVGSRFLVFAADGRGERVIGRQGRGPGEFMAGRGLLALAGDTLLLVDGGNHRLNWVHADVGVVRDRPTAATALVSIGARPGEMPPGRPVGVLPDGRVVMSGAGQFSGGGVRDSVVRRLAPVGLLDTRDGALQGAMPEIARVPDLELVLIDTRYRGRPGTQTTTLRLGRSAHVAVLDSFVVTAHGDDYQVDLRSTTGAVVAQLRVPVARRAVTQAMRDSVIARELERLNADGGGERMVDREESRRQAREDPFADSLPPYSRIVGTRDGLLWVVDAVAPGDTAWSATAFRADGAIVRRLQGSGEVLPLAFTADRVFVRTTDADGVARIAAHRIVPAR